MTTTQLITNHFFGEYNMAQEHTLGPTIECTKPTRKLIAYAKKRAREVRGSVCVLGSHVTLFDSKGINAGEYRSEFTRYEDGSRSKGTWTTFHPTPKYSGEAFGWVRQQSKSRLDRKVIKTP